MARIGIVSANRQFFIRPRRRKSVAVRRSIVGDPVISLGTILLIILILALLGALPSWPYSSGWGYYPSGGLGLILLIVVVLLATGNSAALDDLLRRTGHQLVKRDLDVASLDSTLNIT